MSKKQMIMEKAIELFGKQGIEATSIQQITDYCGISKGAFYLSFKSKDALVGSLIDHFMMEIIKELDQVVMNRKNNQHLLYDFFYTMFETFSKHINFTKFLIKEQVHSLNEELFMTMRQYDMLINEKILFLIQQIYGKKIEHTKYDLSYCIKGFLNSYSSLLLFNNFPIDINLLAHSLVEKTEILATHSSIPFVSKEFVHLAKNQINDKVTKEQMIEMIESKVKEIDDSIEKESLILLKEQLAEPTLHPAIIKGLITNLQQHPECKWISYLLNDYFEKT